MKKRSTFRSLLHLLLGVGLFATAAWPFWQSSSLFLYPQGVPNQSLSSIAYVGESYWPTLFTVYSSSAGSVNATFTVSSGSLPPGLTLSPSGSASMNATLSGTPTQTGDFDFSVRAETQGFGSVENSYSITVLRRPEITNTSMPAGLIGQSYNAQLTGDYGSPCSQPPPYYFFLSSYGVSGAASFQATSFGSLPPGLTLSSDGRISGTPTVAGTFKITFGIADCSEDSSYKALTIEIADVPELTFGPETAPSGMVGTPYTLTLAPSGGTGDAYVMSLVSGQLPPGVAFNAASQTLSGTPAQEGTYRFTIRLTSGQRVFERIYTVVIDPAKLGILPETLPDSYVGSSYTAQLTGARGQAPYTFGVSSGQLPAGLALANSGAITGTPTAAGTSNVTFHVQDATNATSTRTYAMVTRAALTLGPAALPNGVTGEPYTGSLAATGGKAPYQFSLAGGTLPQGLALESGGSITGKPVAIGSSTFTARVTDANKKITEAQVSLTVTGALEINPSTLPSATLGVPYSAAVTAAGGTAPYSYAVSGNLPPGITFSDGTFGGAPASMGEFSLAVTATDASKRTATRNYILNIPRAVTIVTEALPGGTAGTPYTATVSATGGRPSYAWSTSGTLPQGLAINVATGVISGTPGQGGNFSFAVQAADQDGVTATRNFSIALAVPPPPTVTITQLPPTSGPGQQPQFGVQTSSPYPLPINGVVTLTFGPDDGPDDPAVQFAVGGRTANYTIPANGSNGEFTGAPAVQTGTVAGLITLVTRYNAGGSDVTPNPPPTQTLRVEGASPTITSMTLTRTQGGFDVTIFGYSSVRQVTSALIRFNPAPGANVQTGSLTVPLSGQFQTWYSSAGSAPFGSQFKLTIPFTISGDLSGIASVAAQLTNNVGSGNTVTTNF